MIRSKATTPRRTHTHWLSPFVWMLIPLTSCKEAPPEAHPAASAPGVTSSSINTASEVPAVAPSASSDPAQPQPSASVIASLDTPTKAKISVSGCLAAPQGMPDRGALPDRSAPNDKRPKIEVQGGATPRVIHHLDHACCLSATTELKVETTTVTLFEHLSGAPCRCRCSSTIEADLSLDPGDYQLRVVTEQDGKTEEVHSGPLSVGVAPKTNPKLPRHLQVPAAAK